VARAELAFLYLEAGAVEAAEEQMRAAVELRPEEEWVYLEVGRHLVGAGQRELAAEVYVTGLEVLPENRALRTNVGMALWALSEKDHGNLQLAEELTRRLVDSAPDDPLYRAFLALVLMGQGKMDEAKLCEWCLAAKPRAIRPGPPRVPACAGILRGGVAAV
jgi:Flp pilus assembly protein TadD